MASQGPNNPGTIVNDASVGTIAWTNPSDAATSNNLYAYGGGGGTSNYLKCSNFGFSIPSGATIDGITVEIEKKRTPYCTVTDNVVSLVKNGVISGNNYRSTDNWNLTDTYSTYGGSTDLWGLSLTSSDINSSTFGVVINCITAVFKGGQRPWIDHVRITVYYTESGGGGPTSASALLLAGD
jgi:hypothetical protein